MKKALHSFATLLCLLTIMLHATACLHVNLQVEQPKQSACSHCPKPAPHSHQMPPCCVAQQETPAVISAKVETPAQAGTAQTSLPVAEIASFQLLFVAKPSAPPPSPPRISLRI